MCIYGHLLKDTENGPVRSEMRFVCKCYGVDESVIKTCWKVVTLLNQESINAVRTEITFVTPEAEFRSRCPPTVVVKQFPDLVFGAAVIRRTNVWTHRRT
jgi:hypothetical protein